MKTKFLVTKKITAFISLALTAVFTANFAYSLPGVTSPAADTSGEYVFYSDKSFSNESYVGFLYYDEGTYAIRYYSPASANSKNPRLEKDICVYITLNPQNEKIEFTGEKIVGASTLEDADIVNYLHDLFYEFAERRQKITLDFENTKKVTVNQDFAQFGGNVIFLMNPYIPIFNLESIKSATGKELFKIQTSGRLSSSDDPSFLGFKGLTDLPQDKERKFKGDKKAKALTASFQSKLSGAEKDFLVTQEVTLDKRWQKSMDNLWLLDDFALLSFNIITKPDSLSEEEFMNYMSRRLVQSTKQSYAVWQKMKFSHDEASIKSENIFYQPQSKNVTKDIKILTKVSPQVYAYLTLTIFDSVYESNKKYFDSIISSYKIY